MSQAPLHPSPLKEGRRILSEKNPNACLSPARTPTKQSFLNVSSPKKLLPSPSFTAQKRTSSQVDAEDARSRLQLQGQRVETRPVQHGAPARSTTDRDSRPEATTTSISDAMNLDVPEQTTQPQAVHTTKPSHDQPSSHTVPSDPETRKQFVREKASLLRNRLQNAMRHVRDPQFDRRVSELEEHSRKYPRLSGSGSGPGVQIQHLEQKYGADAEKDDEEDEPMLSTPRQTRPRQEQRDEHETTPTQAIAAQQIANANHPPASPSQMLLSSPTYNSNPQTGRFDDDRPTAREATVATSPSSSQRGEGRGNDGDGDAVDGLLKLMGTNPASTGAGA